VLKLKLIILGPPGAGKGTQATILAEKYGLPHISTGQIFRKHIEMKTEIGLESLKYISAGELVPDEIVINMTIQKLKELNCKEKGYILDGFPRTVKQAKALDQHNYPPDLAIEIYVSEDECVKRLSGRRYCPKCGATYNMTYNPPKNDEICDVCGTKLKQRIDDKEEAVRERFKEYYMKTAPVLKYYEKSGKLRRVDGHGSIGEVTSRIEELIEKELLAKL